MTECFVKNCTLEATEKLRLDDGPGQPEKPVCEHHAIGGYDVSADTAREAHQKAMEKSEVLNEQTEGGQD